MCRPVNCNICGKTTWAGCGQHVDQVMARVPNSDRCAGHDNDAPKSASSSASVLSRLFGRG